ncbi:MAG: glutamate racemase [Saprospiraceae bacterium]|nr:glutamate racemase [Candidatus Brachybacter algidus]MBK8844513.1 glutamate racemase [Candidatus Brachybacter algidus]HQW70757.1 glutamate racemase [Saprospiraceae bacterium]
MTKNSQSIGIFDSGYGGLTVFKEIKKLLPNYDFIYLGDNARAPYGNRSFETVYEYTLQCVEWFFAQGCPLVILACNTASAKALRSIQQRDLVARYPDKRVLGVIRPTAEIIGDLTNTKTIGILGTKGTTTSMSYPIEIGHFFPDINVVQQACPMWVPFIENGKYHGHEMDEFIRDDLDSLFAQSTDIDTILLACTHYPLIQDKIRQYLPQNIRLITQGEIVAASLVEYLSRQHWLDEKITKSGNTRFYTTGVADDFETHGEVFFGSKVKAEHVNL